jgi:superfamily I DNA and/or RNA helicase
MNHGEARLITTIVDRIKFEIAELDVMRMAVIMSYTKQRNVMKESIFEINEGDRGKLAVDTIKLFKGHYRRVVILSLFRGG